MVSTTPREARRWLQASPDCGQSDLVNVPSATPVASQSCLACHIRFLTEGRGPHKGRWRHRFLEVLPLSSLGRKSGSHPPWVQFHPLPLLKSMILRVSYLPKPRFLICCLRNPNWGSVLSSWFPVTRSQLLCQWYAPCGRAGQGYT